MKIKNNEDPEMFINTLEKLERKMIQYFKMNILDKEIITKFLNTITCVYKELVYTFQVKFYTGVVVSLNNLKEKIRSKYKFLNK